MGEFYQYTALENSRPHGGGGRGGKGIIPQSRFTGSTELIEIKDISLRVERFIEVQKS